MPPVDLIVALGTTDVSGEGGRRRRRRLRRSAPQAEARRLAVVGRSGLAVRTARAAAPDRRGHQPLCRRRRMAGGRAGGGLRGGRGASVAAGRCSTPMRASPSTPCATGWTPIRARPKRRIGRRSTLTGCRPFFDFGRGVHRLRSLSAAQPGLRSGRADHAARSRDRPGRQPGARAGAADAGPRQRLEHRPVPAAQDQRSVRRSDSGPVRSPAESPDAGSGRHSPRPGRPCARRSREKGLADLQHEAARAGIGDVGLGAQGHARRRGPDALAFGGRLGASLNAARP